MSYGAVYLAALSALVAMCHRGPATDRDEALVLVALCGAMLAAGAALLCLSRVLA